MQYYNYLNELNDFCFVLTFVLVDLCSKQTSFRFEHQLGLAREKGRNDWLKSRGDYLSLLQFRKN